MAGAIAVELLIGLTAGVVAAANRGRGLDRALMVASFTAVSAPQFVVGILLLYVFAVRLGWFPIGGYGTFAHLVLPALTLGILGGGWYARMTRSAMVDVLRQDYIVTARAKGASRTRVLLVHALRNAALPALAFTGLQVGFLLGGAVIVEGVFAYPGIGGLALDAVATRDIPLVEAFVWVVAVMILVANLLIDTLATLLDPRLRENRLELGSAAS
jgi:peptide/nickel transport system permease protein